MSRSEPLSFTLGAGNVLRGMEEALMGVCKDDELTAEIPPEWAYDDPNKKFTRKPVPEGSTVVYHMKVVGISKGQGASSLRRRHAAPKPPPPPPSLAQMAYENVGAIVFVLLVVMVVMVARAPPAPKGRKKPKKKG